MAGPFFTQQYTDLRVIVKSASYNLNNHIDYIDVGDAMLETVYMNDRFEVLVTDSLH